MQLFYLFLANRRPNSAQTLFSWGVDAEGGLLILGALWAIISERLTTLIFFH